MSKCVKTVFACVSDLSDVWNVPLSFLCVNFSAPCVSQVWKTRTGRILHSILGSSTNGITEICLPLPSVKTLDCESAEISLSAFSERFECGEGIVHGRWLNVNFTHMPTRGVKLHWMAQIDGTRISLISDFLLELTTSPQCPTPQPMDSCQWPEVLIHYVL